MNLAVDIGGITIRNPVMPASGPFGYGEEYSQSIDLQKLGALVTKTTTNEPRLGNPQPRIWETAGGMINTIGLQNPGVIAVIQEKIPFLRQSEVPTIVSIGGDTENEYMSLACIFDNIEGISGLEINISCPNTEKGMAFGQDSKLTFEVVSRVREVTSLPLITKLTPNVGIVNIVTIAKAAVEAGTNAVSLINTFQAKAKVKNGPDTGTWIEGGLSGPAIKPVALSMVSQVANACLGVPIIGMGGITCVQDAIEFLEVGASAVAIGTANFRNPKVMEEIIDGLTQYMVEQGINDVHKIIGKEVRGS